MLFWYNGANSHFYQLSSAEVQCVTHKTNEVASHSLLSYKLKPFSGRIPLRLLLMRVIMNRLAAAVSSFAWMSPNHHFRSPGWKENNGEPLSASSRDGEVTGCRGHSGGRPHAAGFHWRRRPECWWKSFRWLAQTTQSRLAKRVSFDYCFL